LQARRCRTRTAGLAAATTVLQLAGSCPLLPARRLPGRAIVISVIDNLVKGASGQAMQNLNLMLGYPETTALMQLAMFP
jgi:N-acetyl-gamma-glutamylphosphate reductase